MGADGAELSVAVEADPWQGRGKGGAEIAMDRRGLPFRKHGSAPAGAVHVEGEGGGRHGRWSLKTLGKSGEARADHLGIAAHDPE